MDAQLLAQGELQIFERDEVMLVMMAEITKVLDFVGETYTDYQLSELARIITDTYVEMDVAELKCCFERIKGGYYGKTYGKLSPLVITEIFSRFWDEAVNSRPTANAKKIQRNTNLKAISSGEETVRSFQPIIISLQEKQQRQALLKEEEKEKKRLEFLERKQAQLEKVKSLNQAG